MTFTPYPKSKSIGIPDNEMSIQDYKKSVKAKKSRNKYNRKRSSYNGFIYDSALEAAYAVELDHRLNLGEIKDWHRQVKLELDVNGKHWRNYFIDFKVEYFDRPPEYVEVKGMATSSWKQKFDMLLILRDEILEPGALIILQFKTKREIY